MKVTLYVRAGEDPDQVAAEARRIIESMTSQPCNVRVSGGSSLSTRTNPGFTSETTAGYH